MGVGVLEVKKIYQIIVGMLLCYTTLWNTDLSLSGDSLVELRSSRIRSSEILGWKFLISSTDYSYYKSRMWAFS